MSVCLKVTYVQVHEIEGSRDNILHFEYLKSELYGKSLTFSPENEQNIFSGHSVSNLIVLYTFELMMHLCVKLMIQQKTAKKLFSN